MTHDETLCQQVEDRLSAFLDDELPPLEAEGSAAHLRNCASCRAIFESLSKISELLQTEGRRSPDPPPWSSVKARLQARRLRITRLQRVKLALLAACLGIVAGAAWFSVDRELPPESDAPFASSGELAPNGLPAVGSSIQMAGLALPGLDQFLHRHRAVEIDPSDLRRHRLSFQPRMPERLPGGFRLQTTYLIEDRCCTGVCLIYRDSADRALGLVQQPPSHPFIWEDARFARARISGTPCRRARLAEVELTQIDPDGRNLTLVAARGFAGLDALVRHLAGR